MKKSNVLISMFSLAALSACAPQDMSFSQATMASSTTDATDTVIPSKGVSQNFTVQDNANIDILFVIDNSPSMVEEQNGLSSKIAGFMSKVSGLNWHIALTTTDPRVNTYDANGTLQPWGDGQFRPMIVNGASYQFLSSSATTSGSGSAIPAVSAADAQSALAAAILTGDKGSGDERGINNMYRSMERSENASFFRANANLVIIEISDEDECSNGNCPSSAADARKSVPANLINFMSQKFGSSKVVMMDAIVFVPGTTCSTASTPATLLTSLSKATGGVQGSICASDYTSILSNAGSAASSLSRSVSLNCNPIDSDNDGKIDFVLKDSNGNVISSGYAVSGKIVTFSLPVGSYSADYRCAQ